MAGGGGGKRPSRHHVGFVSTHKRKVLSVSCQLSKDSQPASGVLAQRRRVPPPLSESAHPAPPPAQMLARALLLCAALALGAAGGYPVPRPAPLPFLL